jgi:hypothetical protein
MHAILSCYMASRKPSIKWVPGALSLGIKRSGREADHTFPFCGEAKNGGAISPFPHTSSWHNA